MDDFAGRLAAWAEAHGKAVEDLGPAEREVAERSVRVVMEREHQEAERAAEAEQARERYEAQQAAHLALLRGMTVFACARLDEDEARSWAVHDVAKCDALLYEEDMAAAAEREPDCDCGYPARVLREVAFKRAILDKVVPVVDVMAQEIMGEWGSPRFEVIGAEALLRLLVATWSDHPGYQPEWAPPE